MPLVGNITRSRALREYVRNVFESHPKLANSITGFLTFSVGDLISQAFDRKDLENKRKYFDIGRSIQFGMLGIAMNGVSLHYWYRFLDKVGGTCKANKLGVAFKVIADQIIYAPFAIIAFFGFSSFKSSENMPKLVDNFNMKMNNNFLPVFAADCTLWPIVNIINFRYISLSYRPTFVAVAQVVWQTYLSSVVYGKNNQLECDKNNVEIPAISTSLMTQK